MAQNGNLLGSIAVATHGSAEQGLGYCPVCGSYSIFLSFEAIDFPCKRNGFTCAECGSVGRNRHIAHAILTEYQDRVRGCDSLIGFAENLRENIWIGCLKESVSRSLGASSYVVRSEFIDGMSSGEVRSDGALCQDIQATSFPENYFQIVISEDVLEHVPDPSKAFCEIRRILKPGGKHIFTIPIDWSARESYARAGFEDGRLVHYHAPEIHGDPFRPDGVLAFWTFGTDVIERFCSLTGPTKLLSAHGDMMMVKGFQIHNSWVFVSQKQ